MESLISDIRRRQQQQQQYAASTAVSQAMLLHALNQTTRQVASRLSANPAPHDNLLRNQSVRLHERMPSPSVNNNQYAPLDLSVKSQVANQRSRPQSKLPKTQHSDIGHLNQSKLITSSTSPTSSASTDSQSATSSEPTCYLRDSNNNQIDDHAPAAAHHQLAHEQISSTNCRRQRTRRCQGAEGAGKRGHKGAARGHLCNFCGRSFSRSDMLTRHSRLHSGLKPYQCSKCYQVFSRSDHLSTHERTHTGEKPYQCQYCDYSACRRDMITRHMRTHSASQHGELEMRVNSRRRRRRQLRKTTDKATTDSTTTSDIKIDERDNEDVSTSFEISVT